MFQVLARNKSVLKETTSVLDAINTENGDVIIERRENGSVSLYMVVNTLIKKGVI